MFFGLLDHTDVHEGLLGQVVPFAVADFFEAADGVSKWCNLTSFASEYLCHKEWLRQKPLYSSGTVNDHLVVFAQLIHAKDRDDVLQFTITLQGLLYTTSNIVMTLTDILWIQNSAG